MTLLSRILMVAVMVALVPVLSAPSEAASAPKFRSCAAMHKRFPAGVAKTPAAARHQVVFGFKRPNVSRAVYRKNRHLDRDRDRVACEKRRPKPVTPPELGPIVVDAPLRLEAISEWDGAPVTDLWAYVCPSSSGDGMPFCRSALTDSAGHVIPTSGNPGTGRVWAPALTPGGRYKLAITGGTSAGYWHCSIYNPDGCSWINPSSFTWIWTFTYENRDGQVVPRATLG